MRRLVIRAALGAALAAQAVVGVGTVHADPNCEARLANNLYRCTFAAEPTGTFEACFAFTSPGTASPNFDLDVNGGLVLACDCQAKGSLRHPLLGASSDFQCVLTPNEDSSLAFTGQVLSRGTKLKKVQAINSDGTSFLGECVIDPTCITEMIVGGGDPFRSR